MREDTRTLLFAAIVCVACSLLLSGTAALLKDRQDANAAFDVQRNIVKAFGASIEGATRQSIRETFDTYISEVVVSTNGTIIDGLSVKDLSKDELKLKSKLPVYTWKENGKVVKYAFPISGKGLWGMLHGYLSLNADLETIAGVSFYKHVETPGLGAEIEKAWFQSQFIGKRIYLEGAPVDFTVSKPGTDLPAEARRSNVDGISGATLTGKGVQALLRNDAALYADYFNHIKGNN